MTDESEITKLLEDAGSEDSEIASEAQKKIATILCEPLIMRIKPVDILTETTIRN